MAGEYYTSKHYSCEEIDRRLLQGTYDDAIKAGFTGSKEDFDHLLANLKEDNQIFLTKDEFKSIEPDEGKLYFIYENDE